MFVAPRHCFQLAADYSGQLTVTRVVLQHQVVPIGLEVAVPGGLLIPVTRQLAATIAAALGSQKCIAVLVQNDSGNTVNLAISNINNQFFSLKPGHACTILHAAG